MGVCVFGGRNEERRQKEMGLEEYHHRRLLPLFCFLYIAPQFWLKNLKIKVQHF